MEIANWIIGWISRLLEIGGGVLGAFVLIDAITRRSDAFVAADRQTKTVWMAITAGAALLLVLAALSNVFHALDLLWDVAIVASLVYLVDVRPKLKDVQRGTRW